MLTVREGLLRDIIKEHEDKLIEQSKGTVVRTPTGLATKDVVVIESDPHFGPLWGRIKKEPK